jgi:hypothetical protein
MKRIPRESSSLAHRSSLTASGHKRSLKRSEEDIRRYLIYLLYVGIPVRFSLSHRVPDVVGKKVFSAQR